MVHHDHPRIDPRRPFEPSHTLSEQHTKNTRCHFPQTHDVIYRRPNLEAFSESYWSGSYMTPPRLSTLVGAADAPPKEAAAGAE